MARFQYEKVAPPKGLRDLPRYLKELLGGFFFRLFYIFRLVWNAGPWTTVILLLIAIFNGFVPVITSLLTTEILNELQTVIEQTALGKTVGSFWGSTILFLLIFFFLFKIFHRVVGRISAAATRIAGEKVVLYVKCMIMNKAKEIDVSAFDIPDFYEKLENANREAGVRPITILQSAFSVVSTVISLISYVIILSTALPIATLCILLVSIPGAIVNFYYRRKNFEYMRRRSKERRQLEYYSKVVTNKDLVKEVRIYKLTDLFVLRFKEVFARYYAGLRKLIVRESVLNVIVSIAAAVTNCIFFALIAIQVFQGKIKIGDYTLLTGAITTIASDVSTLISTSASIYEGTLFIDNLISFMKEEPTVTASVAPPRKVKHGGKHVIVFDHVSFRYPGTEQDVLHDINLTILPGETVVLVGLNGAGKTTLIKLLTRLYDPTEGRILLDGHDIKEYDPNDLYGLFGIIFQDFGKYAFTVAENIRFGDVERDADEETVRAAAVNANADDYISRLPDGYDTPLMRYFEPNATELSIGQWQKLSIARAFYSRSDILILDEPTASLDPMAEQEIFNQFDRLRHDKTTIFVSHRLSSATVASKIIVLEYGKVIEEGDHKTLMSRQGRYFELFTTQAKRYVGE
ncbi:MAG: ABC transporter ATP-binding protein [Clostridia bacterium]|nr:ABC transporter ATP-binding protein [Clostridia bacterium]